MNTTYHKPPYALFAKLSIGLVFLIHGLLANAQAPASTDPWDISQGAVLGSPGFSVHPLSDIRDMFGGSFAAAEPGHTLFKDTNPGGFITSFDWLTPSNIFLAGYNLYANPDDSSGHRAFTAFRLYVITDTNSPATSAVLVDSFFPPSSDIDAESVKRRFPTVQGSWWRMEFVQATGSAGNSGPRIVELDAVVEPPSITRFGSIKREVYTAIPGSRVADLTNSLSYPESPDLVEAIPLFESPANPSQNYGERLSGLLTPTDSASYVFYICSKNQSSLYLSTDDSADRRQLICFEPEGSSPRSWTSLDHRPNKENVSKPIGLVAGKSYYIEAVSKQSLGQGHLAVAWTKTTAVPPADGASPIPGFNLSYSDLSSPVLAGPVTNNANHHVYFLLKQSNWATAEAAARKLGGHLATVRNQAEQEFIFKTFAAYGDVPRYLLIGLYDTDPGHNATNPVARRLEFAWASGEAVTFLNWGPDEPNDAVGTHEYWGQMFSPLVSTNGHWNDCSGATNFYDAPFNGVAEIADPLTVRIVEPAFGQRFDGTNSIVIRAEVFARPNVKPVVDFFADGVKIGEAEFAPFILNWSGVSSGLHSITSRVRDGSGAEAVSPAVKVAIRIPKVFPLVIGQASYGKLAPDDVDWWSFSATAGQKILLDSIHATLPSTRFGLRGPSGWIGFTNLAGDSDLLTLPVSGVYTLAVENTNRQSAVAYSFKLVPGQEFELKFDDTYAGEFVGGSQARVFRFNVTNAGPVRIVLSNEGAGNRAELEVRRSSVPTRGNFEFQAASGGGANRELLIPSASPGSYYVLLYGDNIVTPGSFTLKVTSAGIALSGSAPAQQSTQTPFVMTLQGAGFESGAQVELVSDSGATFPAATVDVDSYSQATVKFPALATSPGIYSVRMRQLDGDTATLTNAISLLEPGQAKLTTRLILPAGLGRHAVGTIYVEYANEGDVSMPAPLLVLKSADPDGSDRPVLTLDSTRVVQNYWSAVLPPGAANEVFILASGVQPGLLHPGERLQAPVYYLGLQQPWDISDTRIEFEIRYWLADDTSPIDWPSRRESLRPPTLDASTWEVVYANLTADLSDTGAYIRMLNDNAEFLGRLGQHITDVDKLWNFEVQQAYGYSTLPVLDSSTDATMPSPGIPLELTRRFSANLRARNSSGPFGYGWYTPWQTRLVLENGRDLVTIIGEAGSARYFTRDSRNGSYFGPAGDTSTLTQLDTSLFELRDPHGTITRFRADGFIDFIMDPNGNRVSATYAAAGQLTSLTNSAGAGIAIAWNGAGLIQSVADSAGRTVEYAYNGSFLRSATTDDGKVTSYTYETGGTAAQRKALSSVTRNGVTRHFKFDGQGRLLSTWLGEDQQVVAFAYDSAGGVKVNDGAGTAQLFFDHRGLLAKTVDPLGNITTAEFDSDLRLGRLVLPTGESRSYTWCSCGSPTSITDELGQTTHFSYQNPFKRLTGFTDARNNTTTYTYDAKGNLQNTVHPDGSVEALGDFTRSGFSQSRTNRRGQPIARSYTASGQLARQAFQDGSYYRYDYDARGNLTNVVEHPVIGTDKTTAYLRQYGVDGDRLSKVIYPNNRWVQYFYDAFGRRQRMTDSAGGDTRYAYDPAGRLWKVSDATDAVLAEYLYNSSGKIERINKGNGTFTRYEYDSSGQVLHLVNYAPNGAVSTRFDYTYDRRGRRTSQNTVDGKWTYEYDGTAQLTHAVFASINPQIQNQDLRYDYDPLGNRTQTVINGVKTEYVVNNLNEYSSVGGVSRLYDFDGNLISDQPRTYSYDVLSRLIKVNGPEGFTEYEYDALGNRVAATLNGNRTEYLLDQTGLVNVVAEYSTKADVTRNAHAVGLIARLGGEEPPTFFEFDAIGSTAATVSISGSRLNRYNYGPFGERIFSEERTPSKVRFIGQFGCQHEEDGSVFMRARYYSDKFGRFEQPDPIRLGGGDLNFYRYAMNSPSLFIDPSGLQWGMCNLVGDVAGNAIGTAIGGQIGLTFGIIIGAVATIPAGGTGALPVGELGAWMGGILGASYFGNLASAALCGQISKPPTNPGGTVGGGDAGGQGGGGTAQGAASNDPNEKSGPLGFGVAHYSPIRTIFPYCIEFENDTNAAAPAQLITMTDQLSPNLDLQTFRLSDLGFGDRLILVPPDLQHFETNVSMTFGGEAFDVQIEAGLRSASGEVYASFRSIVPATSLPPSIAAGFLPPEDGTGRGRGHLSYLISPKTNLATGTAIRNVARIEFDLQTAITTDQIDPHNPAAGIDPKKQALVTIDAGSPSSNVSALPSDSGRVFAVNWSGIDDNGGSGIATFDVYVSTNSAVFLPWITNSTKTSALFVGEPGNSYGFYTVSKDNVGNQELAPPVPDATTRVALDAPLIVRGTNRLAEVGGLLSLTNQVQGDDASRFRWSLIEAPVGLTLNPTNGILRWTPTCSQASRNHIVTVQVARASNTNIYDLHTFVVRVNECVVPGLGRIVVPVGGNGRLPVDLISTVPITNLLMTVETATNRIQNLSLEPMTPKLCSTSVTPAPDLDERVDGDGFHFLSFGLCPGQFLVGTQQIAWLHFTTASNQSSAFVNLRLDNAVGHKTDGTEVRNFAPQSGRVIIVGTEPLLEAMILTNQHPTLILYGPIGSGYRIESTPELSSELPWKVQWRGEQTNLFQELPIVTDNNRTLFFRAGRE